MFTIDFLEDTRDMEYSDLETLRIEIDDAIHGTFEGVYVDQLKRATAAQLHALNSYVIAQLNALDMYAKLFS